MNRKSIVQEYFILALDENGNMPVMHKEECNAGIVAAGVMDLLCNGIITLEKKKITVIKEMSNELEHIISLYTYLSEKPHSTDKLMNDYMVSTSRRIKLLTTEIGESLLADHVVTKGKGGLFGNKTKYIPNESYKVELADRIKSAVNKDDEISLHDMALIYILNETKNLKRYLSRSENDKIKAKLKEMKKNPENKQLANMITYVSDITAVAIACIVTNINS